MRINPFWFVTIWRCEHVRRCDASLQVWMHKMDLKRPIYYIYFILYFYNPFYPAAHTNTPSFSYLPEEGQQGFLYFHQTAIRYCRLWSCFGKWPLSALSANGSALINLCRGGWAKYWLEIYIRFTESTHRVIYIKRSGEKNSCWFKRRWGGFGIEFRICLEIFDTVPESVQRNKSGISHFPIW